MLIKYKNELFNLIRENGFDPSAFEYKPIIGSKKNRVRINYTDSRLYLLIEEHPNDFNSFKTWYSKFEKGFPQAGPFPNENYDTFKMVKKTMSSWLITEVIPYEEELNTTDAWEEYLFGMKRYITQFIDLGSEATFSPVEEAIIIQKLEEAKKEIQKEFNLSTRQIDILNRNIDYLKQSVKRVNKTDWKSIAIGVLTSMLINMGVDTDTGIQLVEFFKQLFTRLPLIQ